MWHQQATGSGPGDLKLNASSLKFAFSSVGGPSQWRADVLVRVSTHARERALPRPTPNTRPLRCVSVLRLATPLPGAARSAALIRNFGSLLFCRFIATTRALSPEIDARPCRRRRAATARAPLSAPPRSDSPRAVSTGLWRCGLCCSAACSASSLSLRKGRSTLTTASAPTATSTLTCRTAALRRR